MAEETAWEAAGNAHDPTEAVQAGTPPALIPNQENTTKADPKSNITSAKGSPAGT